MRNGFLFFLLDVTSLYHSIPPHSACMHFFQSTDEPNLSDVSPLTCDTKHRPDYRCPPSALSTGRATTTPPIVCGMWYGVSGGEREREKNERGDGANALIVRSPARNLLHPVHVSAAFDRIVLPRHTCKRHHPQHDVLLSL